MKAILGKVGAGSKQEFIASTLAARTVPVRAEGRGRAGRNGRIVAP